MIDLFNDDLDKLQPADLYRALIEFMRLGDPVPERPCEGWRFDFKRQWNDRAALCDVAGFANTFGGILIIGVDPDGSDSTRPGSVFQSSVNHEVKLQIANSIATNISPVPWYRITECVDPSDAAKRMWIVQVRAGTPLYLLTKKGSNPVYVRNESGNLPADAARLRALISERIEALQHPTDQKQRVDRMRSDLYVTRAQGGQRTRSATYFLICALPKRDLVTRLDKVLETSFQRIVEHEFPKTSVVNTGGSPIATYKDAVTRDRYELQILHPDIDFERRWAIRSNGDFGFTSQTGRAGPNNQSFWSLFDITIEIIASLKTALSYWRALDYFGEFLLVAYLAVHDLTLLRRSAYPSGLASVCYTKEGSMDARIVSSNAPFAGTSLGLAEVETNTFEVEANLAEVTTIVLNQLLRCGGYSADFSLMKSEVQHVINSLANWQNNPAWFRIAPHPSIGFLSNASSAATS